MFGRVRSAVMLAAMAATAACSGSPSAPGDVPYGTRVDLKAGQSIRIGDNGLKATFNAVSSDSRCPMDALCIDSGNAVLAFRFETDGRAIDRDLHTKAGQTAVPIDGFAVTLLALDPYPRSDRPIAPSDYVAQIRVDRK